MSKITFTKEETFEIFKRYSNGEKIINICKELCVEPYTIYRKLRKHGFETLPQEITQRKYKLNESYFNVKDEKNRVTKGYNPLDKPKGGTDEYTYDFGNEITFEQFKEHVLKQKPMQEKISIEKLKQDDEYVVYLDSVEELEELNKLCGFKVVSKYYGRRCYSPCNWSYSSTSSSTNPGNYIYKGQSSKIITLKDIKEYNMEETQKIIGYECPIDLFQGDIKKGTLYKPTSSTKVVCYAAIGKVGVLGSKYNLPSEIVETWKPVYEDIINMGGYEVEFSKDKIKFDGTEFTKNQLETLEEVLSDNKNIQVTLKHIKADIELLRKLIKNCK